MKKITFKNSVSAGVAALNGDYYLYKIKGDKTCQHCKGKIPSGSHSLHNQFFSIKLYYHLTCVCKNKTDYIPVEVKEKVRQEIKNNEELLSELI